VTRLVRRLAALPRRARAALALAVVLAAVGVAWVTLSGGEGGGGATDGTGSAGNLTMPSTTLNTGGIDVAAPDGWQSIPVPALGFGIAVPPGWEATVLSPEGLATLAEASPAVPGFVDNAHAAAANRGLVYAAGEDAAGGVSDVMVRAAPETGVTDVATLEAYARQYAAQAGRTDPQLEVVDGAARPTVRMQFQVGGDGEVAEGTETLELGPDGLVWSVIVTADDAESQADLASSITDTLTFATG
jgi:hypothetical protein